MATRSKIFRAPLFMFCIILAGCTGLPRQSFNHEANTHIKRIGVLKPKPVKEFTVFYHNHPGINFGLIGAITMAAEFTSKTESYNKSVSAIDFTPSEYFTIKLKEKLHESGYELVILEDEVQPLEIESPPPRHENHPFLNQDQDTPMQGPPVPTFRKKYPQDAQVDAFLDSYFIKIGYFSGSPTSDYKASLSLPVRLVDADNNTLLYAEEIVVGEGFGVKEHHAYLGYDEEYIYANFDNLVESPESSVDGLRDIIERTTSYIADTLKRNETRSTEEIALDHVTTR